VARNAQAENAVERNGIEPVRDSSICSREAHRVRTSGRRGGDEANEWSCGSALNKERANEIFEPISKPFDGRLNGPFVALLSLNERPCNQVEQEFDETPTLGVSPSAIAH
jgi:hypothetical protein